MPGLVDSTEGLSFGEDLIWEDGIGGGTLINQFGPIPIDPGYVTEDGIDFYVAEDGTTFYVQE